MNTTNLINNLDSVTKQEVIKSFFDFSNIFAIPKDFSRLVFSALLVSFLASILCIVYRKTYNGRDFKPSFLQAIFLIALLLSFIMQVIGNSLARAFGMMGAVSIARFRTKVEDAKDTSFVLFSIGIGMACGLGHYFLAAFMTLFTCSVVLVFHFFRARITPKKMGIMYLLNTELPDINESKDKLEDILNKQNISYVLVSVEHENNFSLTYQIRFQGEDSIPKLASEVKKVLGDELQCFSCSRQKKSDYK